MSYAEIMFLNLIYVKAQIEYNSKATSSGEAI